MVRAIVFKSKHQGKSQNGSQIFPRARHRCAVRFCRDISTDLGAAFSSKYRVTLRALVVSFQCELFWSKSLCFFRLLTLDGPMQSFGVRCRHCIQSPLSWVLPPPGRLGRYAARRSGRCRAFSHRPSTDVLSCEGQAKCDFGLRGRRWTTLGWGT